MIPDGVFPCVSLSGGLGTLAVRQGDPRFAGWLVVYRFPYADPAALTELARFPLPAGSPCFPNLYVLDGLTWLAYHDGQQQRLRNMATGTVIEVPGLSNPSAFGAGYFAYTEPVQPYRVHRLDLGTGEVDQPRLGAPTGLSRILDDGRVVTIDEDRFALRGATIPSFAGPLTVGEAREGGGALWSAWPNWPTGDAYSGVLWAGLNSFTPKCAADGDTLAITTAGPDVRLFCGTLAALLVASVIPPFTERVEGPKVNQPQEEPHAMDPKLLDPEIHAIVVELHARNIGLANGTDPQRRVLQKMICQTVRARKGSRFGWKSNHLVAGDDDNAKDALAELPEGATFTPDQRQPLYIWDLFNGTTRKPNPLPLISGPEAENRQYFVPVEPVDHLAGSAPAPDPVTPPSQPPAPSVDLAPLVARIEKLETAQRQDRSEIDNLKARPVPPPSIDLDAVLAGYEVTGDTAAKGTRPLRHSHGVKLAITKVKP